MISIAKKIDSIAISLPRFLMHQKREISLPAGYKTARPKTGDWEWLWRHFRTSSFPVFGLAVLTEIFNRSILVCFKGFCCILWYLLWKALWWTGMTLVGQCNENFTAYWCNISFLSCLLFYSSPNSKMALSRSIQVSFSTSPSNSPTHWKQTVFYLEQPINVTQGKKREFVLLFISTIDCVYKGEPYYYDIPLLTN